MAQSFSDTKGLGASARGYNGAQLTQDLTLSFFEGRSYRAFKEFTANTQMRFVATKPFMLTSQRLSVTAGACKATITVGSTAGGVWTPLETKFSKNGVVSPVPTPSTAVEEGGTIAGGIVREVINVNSGAGSGARDELVGVRLLPPGTYYIQLTVTGTTAGIYAIEYEELETTTS